MKFLAVKLSSLKSELKISKEILQSASREVDEMFKKKYFPEIPAETDNNNQQTELGKADPTNQDHQESPDFSGPKDAKYDQEEQNNIDDPTTEKKKTDPEVKKLFRKIALKIHPDKLIGLEDGYEKSKKLEMYIRAQAAADDNDIIILSSIAMDLDIQIPEISASALKKAEQRIKDIKSQLNEIESTIVWHWFFTKDPKKKEQLLEALFEAMYEKNKNSGT